MDTALWPGFSPWTGVFRLTGGSVLQIMRDSGKIVFSERLLRKQSMKGTEQGEVELSLGKLRIHDHREWERAYEAIWQVAWRSAKRKLPYDSPEQLEDLIAPVLGREIVPQLLKPTQGAFREATSFSDILNLVSRIVSNRAVDEIRRRMRRPESQDISRTSELEFSTVEKEADFAEEVELAIRALDDRFRDVVEDFYFEELTTAEISRKRGRPRGTICSDLVKARRLLGETLEHSLLS